MKRRPNGEGSDPRQRRDGRWHCRVTIPASGLEPSKPKDVYGKSEAECRRNRNKLLAEIAMGQAVARRPPTVAELGELFLNDYLPAQISRGRTKPTTRANYGDIWRVHIGPILGHLRLDELTPLTLTRWCGVIANSASRHTGKPLAGSTQVRIYGVLRNAVSFAYKQGLIRDNPFDRVDPPTTSRPRIDALEPDEIARLLDQLTQHPQTHTLACFMLLTGARPGEALAARWADLDLTARRWKVAGTLTRLRHGDGASKLVITSPKTSASSAVVALPDAAVELLKEHRAQQLQMRLAAPLWTDLGMVFTTGLGTPLEGRNELRFVKAAALRAGISKNVRLHDLRHSTASALLAEGVSMEAASKVLRHTRLATTADIYTHLTETVRREAADALDRAFRRISAG